MTTDCADEECPAKPREPPREQPRSSLQRLWVAALYCTISVAITLLNKRVLSQESFTHVNFLVLAQQVCVIVVLLFCHLTGTVLLADARTTVACLRSRAFLAVIITFLLYVLTSLHGLRFVSVPLFTTLRKTGVACTMIVERAVLGKSKALSREELLGVGMIVVGAVVSGYGDLEYDPVGYALCLFCNFATAAYLVALSKHKANTDMDTPNLLFQCAICAVPMFFVICFASGELVEAVGFLQGADAGFLTCFFLSALMAGVLNIAATMNTRMNSPTTQSVCASLKDVFIVVFAQALEPVVLSTQALLGLVMAFFGAGLHTLNGPLSEAFKQLKLTSRWKWIIGAGVVLVAFVGFSDIVEINAVMPKTFGELSHPVDQGPSMGQPSKLVDVSLSRIRVRGMEHTHGKGDVLATFDTQGILESPQGDFIFYTFMYNKIMEARGNFDAVRHFHGRNCYSRRDALDREDRSVAIDPHWCRIPIIWQLLDEGFDRVIYIDTDILLKSHFTVDKFIRETEVMADLMHFQDKETHAAGATDRSLHGICIQEGGKVWLTSGFLVFHNTNTSYKILKQWMSLYPKSVEAGTTANDQTPLNKVLESYPEAVSLTCSRSLWSHYFNGLGPEVRRTRIRSEIAAHFKESLVGEAIESPYSHLLPDQQELQVV